MDLAEAAQRRQLDDGLDLAFERDRKHHQRDRVDVADARADPHVALGHRGKKDALLFDRALTDEPFAKRNRLAGAFAREGVARDQAQAQRAVVDDR